jgi:hypothetical protein
MVQAIRRAQMKIRKGFLAAFVSFVFIGSAGMFGCTDVDGNIDAAYMAGTYNLIEITLTPTGEATLTLAPPNIEGTITLTESGTFSYSYIILGDDVSGYGTFTVDDPEIVFFEEGDVKGVVSNVTYGIISDGGDTIRIDQTGTDISFTWEVTRQR